MKLSELKLHRAKSLKELTEMITFVSANCSRPAKSQKIEGEQMSAPSSKRRKRSTQGIKWPLA